MENGKRIKIPPSPPCLSLEFLSHSLSFSVIFDLHSVWMTIRELNPPRHGRADVFTYTLSKSATIEADPPHVAGFSVSSNTASPVELAKSPKTIVSAVDNEFTTRSLDLLG
jgi:hypothetical protein